MQPLGDNNVNVPAFLSKLWKMVNDPTTDHLICWNSAGNSFVIQNQAQFWYELLPVYYKHNNMSSFVRQLNMYGFHKVSSVENGTMDADKDEIIFYHPCFQKDKMELLRNIKRKVTGPKNSESTSQGSFKHDDLSRVLTDVKQIRGRQANVDSQLSAMKQENAVLWRELALLRQKHMKQQQIVNKLIHFLVTLVQPPSARMGVGVKRRYPLMLNESPMKKAKAGEATTNPPPEGPTIHELDNEIDKIPDELYQEDLEADHSPMISSPQTPTASNASTHSKGVSSPASTASGIIDEPNAEGASINTETLWDKPEFVRAEEFILGDSTDDGSIIDSLQTDHDDIVERTASANKSSTNKVFLNPSTQDTLLSNLINGSYNTNALNGGKNNVTRKTTEPKREAKSSRNALTVATRDALLTRINTSTPGTNDFYSDDLDMHLESTQSELDQVKDLLNCCGTLDANAILGLFTDESPDYGLSYSQNKDLDLTEITADPLVSGSELSTPLTGSELTTYGINMIDFNELFDDSLDNQDAALAVSPREIDNMESVNTPQVIKCEPSFPSVSKS